MTLSTKTAIIDKLNSFIAQNKIPNIIFHGPSGSGKRTIVYNFVDAIYNNDKQIIKTYTMFADCAHGKGIKFIRDELKFFAKTNINIQGSGYFKTIVLTNADKLTTDAQSALRRCIELFSHNTRFFIIVEHKYNLLKPILSRLCDIFIGGGENYINSIDSKQAKELVKVTTKKPKKRMAYGVGGAINYYKINIENLLDASAIDRQRKKYLETEFNKLANLGSNISNEIIIKLVNKLYEKSYSGIDLMNYIEGLNYLENKELSDNKERESDYLLRKYQLLMYFHKVKTEFRNEKIFMTFIITFFFVRSKCDLENMSFI